MREQYSFPPENQERIGSGKMLLLGQPILEPPPRKKDEPRIVLVQKGDEAWMQTITGMNISRAWEVNAIADEYLSIVQTLKQQRYPFHYIYAHDQYIDKRMMAILLQTFGVKGAQLYKEIPYSYACFPQDMIVDLGEEILVNPQANLQVLKPPYRNSVLAEGGSILHSGRTLFVADPGGYKGEEREAYYLEITRLRAKGFQVGILPWPMASEYDLEQKKKVKIFPTNHLDRVAALIRGKDHQDYLLVDPNYANERQPYYGQYWSLIKKECERSNVTFVVIDKKPEDCPYGLNLMQFADGSILMTKGHEFLERILKNLVGDNMVYHTLRPIAAYPILRFGGMRCLMLIVNSTFLIPKKDGV